MQAIYELLERVIGEDAKEHFFLIQDSSIGLCEENVFELSSENEKVCIKGNNVSAIIDGARYYLKHYLHRGLTSREGRCPISEWVKVTDRAVVKSPFKLRYYLNYCTYSYSMAFWEWERWEQELDWMALHGINVALSLVGQETVTRNMLMKLGVSKEACTRYIGAPTYFAWFFMANMKGYGESLSDQWFDDRVVLANKIHKRMLSLGIQPVLQGFYGMVPEDLQAIYTEGKFYNQGKWCGFERPLYLAPESECFDEVAKCFYETQKELFGDITKYFAVDPFHEGGCYGAYDLEAFGTTIQKHMSDVREDATWVIQAWGANPRMDMFKQVDKQRILILNLLGGRKPLWKTSRGFDGIPWIWCAIHNYGGRNGLYGFLRVMGREPFRVLQTECGESMIGIGMAPEAIDTNPIVYTLFGDVTGSIDAINMEKWLTTFIQRRYGEVTPEVLEAWKLLEDSVYNSFVPQPGGVESFICARPSLNVQAVSTWGPKNVDYDVTYIEEACRLMLKGYAAHGENDNYRYDLVDVGRQVLANYSRVLLETMQYQVDQKQMQYFLQSKEKFLACIKLQEKLLNAHSQFLLGNWVEDARELGQKYGQEELFVQYAKRLITLWGNEESAVSLHDYSAREWAGLTGDFYYMRWALYLEQLETQLLGNQVDGYVETQKEWVDNQEQKKKIQVIDWYTCEEAWINKAQVYPTKANGNIPLIIEEIMNFII